MEYEDGLKNLNALISWEKENKTDKNESTTRLQLIDRLFFECLGWERGECITEERLVENYYVDYSFRCPQCLLIVEAKKQGLYFELPIGKNIQKQDIKYFQKNYKEIFRAIEQSANYCQKHGSPYGAVCNGNQLIMFVASRIDGSSPLDSKALVFESLENISDNFLLVWQCISKPGIMARRISIELQDTITAAVPEKLSKTIIGYPGQKARNQIQTDLQILGELFIEDIASQDIGENEKEFLKECYCESGALSQYATISKDILKARYSAVFQEQTEGPTLTPILSKKGLSPDFIAKSLSRRPILLVGDIGVGKTMFIKHLYQVRETEIFNDAIVFYIDLGHKPALEKDLTVFVENEITKQLNEKYNINIEDRNFVYGVLHKDIEMFSKGIYSDIKDSAPVEFKKKQIEYIEQKVHDKENYLKKCLHHIEKGRKKQLVMFLDNVDQRPNEFQDQTFLLAESIADNWPMTVFLTIRPETFYRSKMSGTISAYHPRAFTIAPPRVDEVVIKRLGYGLKLLKNNQLALTGDVKVKSKNLEDYLAVLVYSFSNNLHLMQFLDNMVGGNIRLALSFVRSFIGSGHVDTGKILGKYREKGSYLVPLHEFIRAITYGEHEHYSPNSSEVVNLFDISIPDGKEHFLCPIILAQLDRWAQNSQNDGYVSISEISGYAQSIGFIPSQIDHAIETLVSRNLIDVPSKNKNKVKQNILQQYRITSIGSYYVKKLMGRFVYFDAMVVDTPLIDRNQREMIADVDDISDRLARAKLFCNYLDSQWVKIENNDLAFSWASEKWALKRDIEYITGKISIKEDILPDEEKAESSDSKTRK
jgi:hypothetical protein